MKKSVLIALLAACGMAIVTPLAAQDGGPFPGGPDGRGGRGGGPRAPAYPARVTDPAAVERGKTLYTDSNCAGCHAIDIRGSDRGPNLLRSQLVLRDRKGELIAPVIRNGSNTMPASANLTDAQIADIAEYLHSFPINSRDPARQRPQTIVTGNAAAGQVYFQANCSACHSAAGDLKGLGTKYADPRTLQGRFLAPVATQDTTVTVVPPHGAAVEGRLLRIDEFYVSLVAADGSQQTFARKGGTPAVVIHDRLAAHKALLPKYTDRDIHDLTAYLVTLK